MRRRRWLGRYECSRRSRRGPERLPRFTKARPEIRTGVLLSAVGLGELQSEFDFTASIITGNGAHRGTIVAMLGVDFIIHVWVEAAETIASRNIGDVSPHGQGSHVLQIDDAGRDGILSLVDNGAVHGLELRVLFLLREGGRSDQEYQQKGERRSKQGRHAGWAARKAALEDWRHGISRRVSRQPGDRGC